MLIKLSRLFPVVTTFSVTIGDNREKNTVVIGGGNWEYWVCSNLLNYWKRSANFNLQVCKSFIVLLFNNLYF